MRLAFFLLVIILGTTSVCGGEGLLPESVVLPTASPAVCDDAMATVFIPAGLGVKRGFNGYYIHTVSGEAGGDNAFIMSSSGFGFGAEFLNHGAVKFNKYTLSNGAKLSDSLYLGSSYAWFNSDDKNYDRLSSWDIGLLHRPSNHISTGFVVRNLNRPSFNGERTSRLYDLSLAFRPYTNRITFSVNGSFEEGKKIRDASVTYALGLEPFDGVILRGSYNNDGNFDIRIGMGFPMLEIGSYSRFDSDRKHDGGAVYARLSSERRRSSFQTGSYVLEVIPSEINQVQIASGDKTIKGVIIKTSMDDYGMGRLQEMRDTITDFKVSGKKSVCYMGLGGNKEYYLATACDKILLNRAGYLALTGLRSEASFYGGMLSKLGIEAEIYRSGKYKSASEMLTNEGMSDASRESSESLLDDLHDQMVSGIARGRNVTRTAVEDWINDGPYTASRAEKSGLVDGLVYADEVEDALERMIGRKVEKISGKEYGSRSYYNYDWGAKPKIAIIYADGLIAPGKSFFAADELPVPGIMGSDTICEAIKETREDDSVKAIVLRIDSEGGSVFASDLIWREVVLARESKPVVVSMGDAAASGGYYIACPANAIVAEPGTVTGSIGVIAGKLNMRGFYEKLGIKKEIIKKGKNSDFTSFSSGFTDEQKEILNRQIDETYTDFVRKVAQGRKMQEKDVDAVAQGRVWTGRQAKSHGLVDELGGLSRAVYMVEELAGLKKYEGVDFVILPRPVPLWQRFIFDEMSSLNFLWKLMKAEKGLIHDRLFFMMPYAVNYE